MWPEGQLWKPGPATPATVAASPPAPCFRIRIFCNRGSLTPVAAPNASPNVFLAWGRMRRSGFGAIVLRDVAWGPSVETGANVPGYSGGLAACAVVSDPDLLVARPSRSGLFSFPARDALAAYKPRATPWAFTLRPVGAGKAWFVARPLPFGLGARQTEGAFSMLTRRVSAELFLSIS